MLVGTAAATLKEELGKIYGLSRARLSDDKFIGKWKKDPTIFDSLTAFKANASGISDAITKFSIVINKK